MRVAIDGGGDVLRCALGDLVRAAGHEVASGEADLRILVGEGPTPPGARTPEPDAAARSTSGRIVRADPLDPDRLLDLLGGGRPRPSPSAGTGESFETSPDPWLGLDPDTRTVAWANTAARRALAGDAAASVPAPENGWGAALEHEQGRSRVAFGGRAWSATWWTDTQGLRVVGLGPPDEPVPPHVRSLAELGRTSATLAHELRNPVAAFAGAVDLLSTDLSAADRREVSALARRRVEQMGVLLDDTLRLARPFQGPPSPVECAAVLRSAALGVGTDPRFAGVRVTVRVEDESVRALGYEQPLRQALTNLLVNAVQAQGGAGAVEVSLTRRGDRVELAVVDEGPGIPEPLREKVFEPFWTTKSSGTGLGLAYVRRVAQACGGDARAESAGPRGARLVLELPIVPYAVP